jgi:hypothetical protein
VLIACLAGFLYLAYKSATPQTATGTVCFFKTITGYACPSCGTTRAIVLLVNGKIFDSLLVNPFGILVFLLMVLLPLWIIRDIILKQNSFFLGYKKLEKKIQNPYIASALLLIVVLNWIWNLSKQL